MTNAQSETINRDDMIGLFHQLMQPASRFRVLCLLGQAKLGKSHLMTKVFPFIAQDYGARCAVITLRSQEQNAADILHAMCGYLGGLDVFSTYQAAYQEMQNRATAQVSGVQALFSRISVKAEAGADAPRKMGRELVPHFVRDLGRLNDAPAALLFDAVDNATGVMQAWLTDTLVGQLSSLAHVRIVMAGRSVPDACGSYAAMCEARELLPVEEEEAYITYCRQIGVPLVEQSIRDIARLLDYKPGMFVDHVLLKFPRREAAHA